MASQSTKMLYRSLLQQAGKFHSYNYRNYALRRIREEFRKNRNVKDQQEARNLIEQARSTLQMLRRQVAINSMYHGNSLVVE